uniref:Cytochrome P450 n=1 Tax=Glossina brevipalpis TaxID=37001 RepID=A0A1A9W8I1_9MUSC
MNILALIAFALWAIFMRCLPQIIDLIRIKQWSESIPGPSLWQFVRKSRKIGVLDWLKLAHKQYGPVFRIWMGKDLFVFFTDPDDIKTLLSSTSLLHKSSNYKQLDSWLGEGLLLNGGEAWHERRKLLTPAFHFNILSEFKEPMEENCQILIERLKEKATTGEPFDVYPYITLFALDVIYETAMGLKKHAQLESDSVYVKAVQEICRIYLQRNYSILHRNNTFFKFSKLGREHRACVRILHDETDRLLKLKRKMFEECTTDILKTKVNLSDDLKGKRRLAFLDMLLISQMEGMPLTDKEIREEVDTFMFAGHDTVSSVIAFTIYLLSQNANIQQQAYEELLDAARDGREYLPYLEAVIKESLRFYTVVPFFSRQVTEDLRVGSIIVPKKVNVAVFAYMTHRDERYYPQPEKFDPTRFLQNDHNSHTHSFVPFSAGPRNCIGQRFAMLELKCALSSLLRTFEFLPVEGFQPILLPAIVMKSENGVKVRLKLRN